MNSPVSLNSLVPLNSPVPLQNKNPYISRDPEPENNPKAQRYNPYEISYNYPSKRGNFCRSPLSDELFIPASCLRSAPNFQNAAKVHQNNSHQNNLIDPWNVDS